MKKLQMNNEHRALIESIVKAHPAYLGNEELLDIFCEAIYKKSYLLIDAIKDMSRLKRHLTTISEGCIEQVLRQKQKFNKTKKAPEAKEEEKDVVSLKEEVEYKEPKEVLIDPITYNPRKQPSEKTVDKLIKIVKSISERYPKKKYYDIFFLRYIKGFDQTHIAYEMKISQVELSKRFVELIKLTQDKIQKN